jgi:hypothetical protein
MTGAKLMMQNLRIQSLMMRSQKKTQIDASLSETEAEGIEGVRSPEETLPVAAGDGGWQGGYWPQKETVA